MHHGAAILLALFAIFVAAQIGAEIAQRLKLPGVVGEIVAGCAIGPAALGLVSSEQIAAGMPLDVLAEIGVVLLLFSVGLETRLDDLKKVGRSAFLVGVLGVIVPFVLGALWAHGSGFEWTKSMFVAAAFVATSAGITARVLQELGVLTRIESRVILGAAVIDDILAMLLLGVVTSLQGDSGVNVLGLLLVLAQAVGFVAVIGWVGTRVMRRRAHWLDRPIDPLSPADARAGDLSRPGLSCPPEFGLAAIIGAFLAGMVASETHAARGARAPHCSRCSLLLTPFFFVITGAKIDLGVLASGRRPADSAGGHRHRARLEADRRRPRRASARPAQRADRRRGHGAARRGRRGHRQPRPGRRRVLATQHLRAHRGDVAADLGGHAAGTVGAAQALAGGACAACLSRSAAQRESASAS
jgi:Kef-type K+ transport system membrane component KefB